eukprot:m.64011 g.64011  ORF g.64011 m.64011 type:complete len:148 (-) comp49693_c0_seq2:51-494(-)
MGLIYALPIPLELEWPDSLLLPSIRVMLDMILESVCATLGFTRLRGSIGAHLFRTRYQRLLEGSRLTQNPHKRVHFQQVCSGLDWQLLAASLPSKQKLQNGTQEIVKHFLLITEESIFMLLFGNYVEHVVSTVVGADGVAEFLRSCL